MTISHLNKIRDLLNENHWIIVTEEDFSWNIARPNGDTPLQLSFPAWYGAMGEYRETSIEKSINCEVVNYPDLDVYFGKYSRTFQKEVQEFVAQINQISTLKNA